MSDASGSWTAPITCSRAAPARGRRSRPHRAGGRAARSVAAPPSARAAAPPGRARHHHGAARAEQRVLGEALRRLLEEGAAGHREGAHLRRAVALHEERGRAAGGVKARLRLLLPSSTLRCGARKKPAAAPAMPAPMTMQSLSIVALRRIAWGGSGQRARQRLLEVGDQVAGVLEAHRQAQQVRRGRACRRPRCWRGARPGSRRRRARWRASTARRGPRWRWPRPRRRPHRPRESTACRRSRRASGVPPPHGPARGGRPG